MSRLLASTTAQSALPARARQVLLAYTLLLCVATLLPAARGMTGPIYLICAIALGGAFIFKSWRLLRSYSEARARRTFRSSIAYLGLLFLG